MNMDLLFRVPFFLGAFLFTLTVFWSVTYLFLGWATKHLRQSASKGEQGGDDQVTSMQTSSSGPNISTGDVQGDSVVHVHVGEPQRSQQPVIPPDDDAGPEEQEDDPPTNSPQEPPQTPPEGASALYPPIRDDELAEEYFEKRTVYISDFARKATELGWTNAVIAGRTFKQCRILGPAVLAPMSTVQTSGYTFVDCWWADGVDAFWIACPEDHTNFAGVIGLENCLFQECAFTQVGILVQPVDYERYRKRYGDTPTPQQ
jgi:hypothetical protein